MNKNFNNMEQSLTYSDQTIVGLLDSDGTHTIRILRRTNTPSLGITVLTSFNQSTQNFDAIEAIKQSYEDARSYSFEQHTGLRRDNTERNSSRVDLNWNTTSGGHFYKMLENKKSLAPGKQRDYLIAKKCHEFSKNPDLISLNPSKFKEKNGSYPLVEHSTDVRSGAVEIKEAEVTFSNKQPLIRKEKVSQIAIAYLARQTSEKSKESAAKLKKRFRKIEEDCAQSTPEEKALGYKLGKYYCFQIEQKYKQEYESIRQETSLPSDYILGMHIGDGTLGCEIRISNSPGRRRYEILPFMRVNQSNDSYGLLETYRNYFGTGTIEPRRSDSRYKLAGARVCKEKLIPIFEKYKLPKTKQLQYYFFREICEMVVNREHLTYDGF